MRWLSVLLVLSLSGIGAATEKPKLFVPKKRPQPGDWLSQFHEPGQTFKRYVEARPVRARKGQVIRFVPIGPFTKQQTELLEATAELTRIWYQLDVEVGKPQPLPKKDWQRMVAARKQFRTSYFLDHLLPPLRDEKAVTVCGITMADLYPNESWNFVFGEARLRGGVGVWSFARLASASRAEQLRRCFKIVTHEIGHTFGLEHCIYFECNMNGSNSLGEMDRQPLALCPVCLKKLRWNRGFRHAKRYGDLQAFYRRMKLEPEARWITSAISYLRTFRSAK